MSESEPPTDAESTRPFDGRPPVEGVHRGAVEILDAIGQAVIATDLEGTVTYWSPAAEELYGWSAEEAVGRPVQRLTPSEAMRLRADEIMEEIRETGSWTGEFELTRRDGSRFTGLVTNALVHDREGRPVGMVGVSSDISDLKATEAALRERVKEMRTLIRATEILADGTRDRAARIQAFVDAIPSGWLDPDTTEALLTFDDQTYRSEGYRDSEHAIEHPVDVDGLATGRLRVVRTEVPAGAPAFIPEEVDLLRTLARTVGDAISRERSVRRLYRTVEALDVAIFLIESDTRVVRSANSAAERIFGRPREEMVGSTTEQLHVDRDRYEKFGEESARVLERGEVFHASIDMVRADGEVFPAEQTVSLLDPERGLEAGAVSVVRDMSEAHRARQEVARAQQRFRTIAEHLEDVLWIGSPADGAIEYVSPSYERVWGRHADRLLDDPGTWLEGVHPEDVAHVARTDVLDPTNHPLERDIQYRIVRPDGEVRWIHDRTFSVRDANGEITRVIGVAADISERRQAEERLAAITREISDAIYVLAPDGRVRLATASVARNTGFTVAEFEGVDALALVHPSDRERVEEQFRWVAAVPGRSTRVEYCFVDRDGQERQAESLARNLVDHPGIEGILVATRDVTARVEMERALQQSQRLEAVGRLAGGIAHDFNNLLTVIRSQASMLEVDLEDAALREEVEVIENAADRAAELTGQLLAFSREQVLQPRPVNICEVVERIATLVGRTLGSDIDLETRLHGDLPTVELDPTQLEQALLNLALNARDAMPEGGRLLLETRTVRVGETSEEFSAIPAGTYVGLIVSDTGVGMEPEVASRVFEPFFTTKSETGGTGLGLATAYGFVRQSGGDISLETRPGVGTTFRLVFPAVAEPSRPLEAPDSPPVDDASLSGHLILVEDDEAVRRVAKRILARSGLEVTAVGTAEAAVEHLEAGREIDGVLTDLGLPGMSGRDLLDWCREHRPGLPVAIMSGYAADSPGGRRGIPGDAPFLPKPFTPQKLVRTARDLVTSSGGGA